MSVGLTIDEDNPGSNTALGSGPALCVCVRVMSVCVESPMSLACSWLDRALGLCPIWCSVTRGFRWVSPTALGSGPSVEVSFCCTELYTCTCASAHTAHKQTYLVYLVEGSTYPWDTLHIFHLRRSPSKIFIIENEKSLKKNLNADEEKPYISVSKETSLIFIYCQLSQMAAAQGFLPIGVTLDASHNPSESCYLRWVSLDCRQTVFDAIIFSPFIEKCCAVVITLPPLHCQR